MEARARSRASDRPVTTSEEHLLHARISRESGVSKVKLFLRQNVPSFSGLLMAPPNY